MVMVDLETPSGDVSRASTLNRPPRKAYKKSTVRIVSQNARGLKSDERIEEITRCMYDRDIFATFVQATWRTGNEVLDINSHKLILSGLPQQTCTRGSQGVGIILGRKAVDAWREAGCEVYNHNARVIAVRLFLHDIRGKVIYVFLVSLSTHQLALLMSFNGKTFSMTWMSVLPIDNTMIFLL